MKQATSSRRNSRVLGAWFKFRKVFCHTHTSSIQKLITNRLTNKFDEYQQREQAGFRKSYSAIAQIDNIRLLIEKYNEYNVPLHLDFIDYSRV